MISGYEEYEKKTLRARSNTQNLVSSNQFSHLNAGSVVAYNRRCHHSLCISPVEKVSENYRPILHMHSRSGLFVSKNKQKSKISYVRFTQTQTCDVYDLSVTVSLQHLLMFFFVFFQRP